MLFYAGMGSGAIQVEKEPRLLLQAAVTAVNRGIFCKPLCLLQMVRGCLSDEEACGVEVR